MHLILVISSLNPGGAERVLSTLANHWVSQGHTVSLITFSAINYAPFYSLDPKINFIELGESESVTVFPLFFRRYYFIKRLFYLRKTIKRLNPDKVISFIDMMNIIVLMVTRGLRVPVVISERIDPNYHPISKLTEWLRYRLYPFAACLVVQTESAVRYFPPYFKKFTTIIPNPVVCPEAQKKSYANKIQYVVTVGRLDDQKGHDILIRVFAIVAQHYPELTLTLYGEGVNRKNLEALIVSLGLDQKVFLPGTTKKIQEILRDADLFVFPSRYEGFPNALCEAMAAGLPVIASNCSGNIDVVRDGIDGRLFPVDDMQSLTNIMLTLLGNPVQCEKLGCRAKEISDRFHSDRIFGLWDKVIKR